MSDLFTVLEQVRAHDLRRLIEYIFNRVIDPDLVSAFGGVEFGLFPVDAAVVDDYEVEMYFGRVLLDRCEVRSRCVAVSLARLRHQVVDENLRRTRLADHPRDLRH